MAKDDTIHETLRLVLKRIARAERLAERANGRVRDVLNAKKHYLRHRLPSQNKLQNARVRIARMTDQLKKILGKERLQMSSCKADGSRRAVVMLSQYERIKLFRILGTRVPIQFTPEEAKVLRGLVALAKT